MIPNGKPTYKQSKYALTISPPNRVKYTKESNPNKNLYMDDKLIIKNIMKYIKVGTYIIYPEFDIKGRLHYHGIIDMDHTQYVRYMKYAQFKLPQLGFTDIKKLQTYEDNLKWVIYMSKEWGTTREILEISRPIMKYPVEEYNKKQNCKTTCENAGELKSGVKLSKLFNWGGQPLPS